MRRLVVLCTRRILMLLSILFIGRLSVATPQNLYTVETTPPRGFMPSADQLASPVDSIDPVSGKLHVEIPLASLPRTRGGFGFDLGLVYDSHLYDIFPGRNRTHLDRKSTRLNSSHITNSYAVFC